MLDELVCPSTPLSSWGGWQAHVISASWLGLANGSSSRMEGREWGPGIDALNTSILAASLSWRSWSVSLSLELRGLNGAPVSLAPFYCFQWLNNPMLHAFLSSPDDSHRGVSLRSSFKKEFARTSLVIQWLRFRTFSARVPGSIPGWETRSRILKWRSKILCAATKTQCSQKKEFVTELQGCG